MSELKVAEVVEFPMRWWWFLNSNYVIQCCALLTSGTSRATPDSALGAWFACAS